MWSMWCCIHFTVEIMLVYMCKVTDLKIQEMSVAKEEIKGSLNEVSFH